MKNQLNLLALFGLAAQLTLSSVAFAGAPPTNAAKPAPASVPQVDCSKAAKGIIVIKQTDDRMTVTKAAELAYQCLSTKQASIVANRKAVIAKAKNDESPTQCGQSDAVQTLLLKSWNGERPYPSQQPDGTTLYSVGGESSVLVREPITCDGIGSGMYSGIVGSISIQIDAEESATFDMEDESKPLKQEITLTFKKLLSI